MTSVYSLFTWVATTDVVSTERLKVLLGLDTAVTNVCSTSLASGISAGVMVLLNTTSTSASVSDARVLVPARLNEKKKEKNFNFLLNILNQHYF